MNTFDKVCLSISIFIITFSLGITFTFASLSFLFAKGFISVNETPEYIVDFVNHDSQFEKGE